MLQTEMATFRSYPAYPLNAPGSQESLASYGSGTATSASRSFRAAGSDTVSQTTADTEMTSPTSPSKPVYSVPVSAADEQRSAAGWRMHTPEDRINASDVNTKMTSPMAITTPVNGHKRMASGQIKYSELPSPVDASRSGFQSTRAASVGSAGSRVSEAASNLKERLSYAMAKVQHGWEHHNIDQVEQLAAAAISPRRTIISPRSARSRPVHTSPRSAGLPARALVDQFSSHRIPFPDSHSRSAPLPASSSEGSMSPPQKRRLNDAPPSLAPAARFVTPPSPHHRRSASSQQNDPTTPKATVRRTQTQTAAAEQEAMSALLLMGSPSNSQPFVRRGSVSRQSSVTQSPRRHGVGRSESWESGRRGRDEVLDRIEAES